jgi:hypothetical protein
MGGASLRRRCGGAVMVAAAGGGGCGVRWSGRVGCSYGDLL